jgi:pectinesterase
MYNVDVKNTRGAGIQAGALSEYGSRAGFYGCGFYGYQDTLYANVGTQVYLKGYIEVSMGQEYTSISAHVEP